jgi:hypothetical protein
MRISALLITTAILGGVAGSTARAQTATGSSASASAPTVKAQTGSTTSTSATSMKAQTRGGTTSSLRKAPAMPTAGQSRASQKKSSRKIPPAPPLVGGVSPRQGSTRKPFSTNEMFLADPSGRKDQAGHPVPFYPSARSLTAAKSQTSAARSHTARVRENPQHQKSQ